MLLLLSVESYKHADIFFLILTLGWENMRDKTFIYTIDFWVKKKVNIWRDEKIS